MPAVVDNVAVIVATTRVVAGAAVPAVFPDPSNVVVALGVVFAVPKAGLVAFEAGAKLAAVVATWPGHCFLEDSALAVVVVGSSFEYSVGHHSANCLLGLEGYPCCCSAACPSYSVPADFAGSPVAVSGRAVA